MNSTPTERIILKKFRKHLRPNMFAIYVLHLYWIEQLQHPISLAIYPSCGSKPLFIGKYASQQEVLDKAEEVCMMVVFGVQGA